MKLLRFVLVSLMMIGATGSYAMFRAADLVVIPVAASVVGLNDSYWLTDLEIVNADTVPVDVVVVFLPSGNYNNWSWFKNIADHLGGRADEGYGHVNERLADLQPGRSVVIGDIVNAYWGPGQKGALLLFALEAGSLNQTTPPGGVPRRIIATSRTYTRTLEGTEIVSTYGQKVPGLPWYDYIDPQKPDTGFDHVIFSGIREDARFRTSIGLVNISDELTTLRVLMTLNDSEGVELASVAFDLKPLAHVQYDEAVRTYFRLTAEVLPSLADATVRVSVVRFSSSAANPTPALMAYAVVADNSTNDPSYVEQTFTTELPWDCVFNGNCAAASVLSPVGGLHKRRPLATPTLQHQ